MVKYWQMLVALCLKWDKPTNNERYNRGVSKMPSVNKPLEGGCTCGHVRYRLTTKPLIVHCCHCSLCQNQTGSAFVVNALYDAKELELLSGDVNEEMAASPSGKGQRIGRCPKCHVAVWSQYYMSGIRDYIRFIRVGTTDDPSRLPPDVHIFTQTTLPWVNLANEKQVEDIFYDYETTWSKENNARRIAMFAQAGLEVPKNR